MPRFDQAILALGPTGYWKLDEYRGNTAFDFSQNKAFSSPLTSIGVALGAKPGLCSDWPHGAGLGTIPDGHLVSAHDPINAPFATYGAITIVALINPSNVSSGEMFIVKAGGANQDYTDWAFGLNNKRLRYSYWNTIYNTVDSIDNQIALNMRAFVVMTRNADGRTINFYVNGVVTADSPLVAPSVPLHAGGHIPDFIEAMGVDLGSTFLGLADEIAVFVGQEFNAGLITNLYNYAIRIWPNSLPGIVAREGYKETMPDAALRSQMSVGEVMSRPIMSASSRPIDATLDLYGSQRTAFENFYTDALEDGTMSFEASLRGESYVGRYMFVELPSFEDLEGDNWKVSMKLIEFP